MTDKGLKAFLEDWKKRKNRCPTHCYLKRLNDKLSIICRKQIDNLLQNPNTLTLFRMPQPGYRHPAPVPQPVCTFLAALLFSAAAITDYLDGFFARRGGLVSNFGKTMDPLADKLLVASPLIMLTSYGWVPAWMVCVIVGRELAVTGLRNIISEKGRTYLRQTLVNTRPDFRSRAIIPLLLHYPYLGINMHGIGTFLLWGALGFTLWSGADYFIRFRKLLKI